MKNFGGINNLMKQASQMQKKLEEMQKEVAKKEIEATSGGGMVKVVVNGKQEVLKIDIEKNIIDEGDQEMLQDLILAAVNKGIKSSQDMVKEEMASLGGDMGLPNIPGLF